MGRVHWSSTQPPPPLMPFRTLCLCQTLPVPKTRPFLPWVLTRPSISHLWGEGGISTKVRRSLRGIYGKGLVPTPEVKACVFRCPQTPKYKSPKRMDGQRALPRKAGPALPPPPPRVRESSSWEVATSTAALCLVCESLLPWEHERQVLPAPRAPAA